MIIHGIPVSQIPESAPFSERAVAAFLRLIERRLGVSVVKNARGRPESEDLIEPLRLAALLQKCGIIQRFGRGTNLCDEPHAKSWYAICNVETNHQTGGTNWESDSSALYAALAEALERYIWFTQTDYFVDPVRTTLAEIEKKGPFIPPQRCVGFSEEQRALHAERALRDDARYLWIKGISLVTGKHTYVPAQLISGAPREGPLHTIEEPLIRWRTTNGLATWPTKTGARLAGILEVVERDAYMITWLNQISPRRFNLSKLCDNNPVLARIVDKCERYRLRIHALQMVTDAPTHAVLVVLEDMSGFAPRFSIGLKAHRSLSHAIQKAIAEATRARRGYRLWSQAGNVWDMNTPVHEIGHRERLYYWGAPEHAKNLEFLIQGSEIEEGPEEWHDQTEEEYLQYMLRWCAKKNFECVSVSLGTSASNPTHFHIEMVIVPELHPAYLTESTRVFGGTRLKEVPLGLGYTPRNEPFADAPHPFS